MRSAFLQTRCCWLHSLLRQEAFSLFVPETNDPLALADLFLTIQNEINDEQRLGSFEGTLTAPEVEEIAYSVGPDLTEQTISLIWDDLSADLDLAIEKPDGSVIDTSNWTTFSGVDRITGPGIEYFTVTAPDVGDWKAHLSAVSGTANYALVLSGQSSIEMDVFFDKDEYAPNAPILISAALTESITPVTGATVVADVVTPTAAGVTFMKAQQSLEESENSGQVIKSENGKQFLDQEGTVLFTSESLTLFDDGTHGDGAANDGVYANSFTDTQNEGTYSFAISATGTSPNGIDFVREASVATVVTATATAQYTLAVSSAKPDTNVTVTITPSDVNGATDGSTPFSRLYNENTLVSLTAPDVASNGFVFEKWVVDDTLEIATSSIEITMDTDRSASAMYLPALPHSYLLLADNTVTTEGHVFSEGDVHANGRINFNAGAPTTHQGNLIAHSGIIIQDGNTIEGDLISGGAARIGPNATITGTVTGRCRCSHRTTSSILILCWR